MDENSDSEASATFEPTSPTPPASEALQNQKQLWTRREVIKEGVERLYFRTAEAFLDALHPRSGLWGAGVPWVREWIFRGHSDADWDLLPAIHRARVCAKWGFHPTSHSPEGVPDFNPANNKEQLRIHLEQSLIREFEESANAAGMPIPDAGHSGRVPNWPSEQDIQTIALAQHSGVPTRLLDWTRRGAVAAYFAALSSESWKPEDEEPDCLAVWALNSHLFSGQLDQPASARCQITTARRASNRNLHAQDGIFTCTFYNDNVSPEENLGLAPVDVIASIIAKAFALKVEAAQPGRHPWRDLGYPMKQLVLSRSRAHELLELLHLEGVSAMTLFPDFGYGSVARYLREKRR